MNELKCADWVGQSSAFALQLSWMKLYEAVVGSAGTEQVYSRGCHLALVVYVVYVSVIPSHGQKVKRSL